jgi:hypothetical protein
MQAFLRFRALLACGFAVAAALLIAAPASAASEPPPATCITSSSCIIQLNYYVSYFGSTGGSNGVAVTPPPCLAVAVGDAHVGSQIIISFYDTTTPVPVATTASANPSPSDLTSDTGTATATAMPSSAPASATPTSPPPTTQAAPNLTPAQQTILNKAEHLVNSDPMTPGEWYQISADPAATAAASQVCANLPPYVWAANGKVPVLHGLHIPVRTLAELAYSQLMTPGIGAVELNPRGTSDTNLPTFVDVVLNRPPRGVPALTTQGIPYVYATAVTPDGTAATVYAVANGLNIDPGTSSATTYNVPQCGVAQPDGENTGKYILGSRDVTKAGSFGAGQPIDCGVTYTAPGPYQLTVSVGWSACWAPGTAAPGGPPAGCDPNFPGATGLQDSTTGPVAVSVREIQSVNG